MREGKEDRTLKYYLGSGEDHTVYEGELVGMLLAMELLRTERHRVGSIAIGIDNQAAIRAAINQKMSPGHYILDYFDKALTRALNKHGLEHITVRWTPGHIGIEGNEKADTLAKEAARGDSSETSNLPLQLR
ncbi:hypothetical protein BV22DRAFT_1024629, partial [Leucogyrophana mollusca]